MQRTMISVVVERFLWEDAIPKGARFRILPSATSHHIIGSVASVQA